MATYFLADSRSTDALPRANRYLPIVHKCKPRAFMLEDTEADVEEWAWCDAWGSSGGAYESEATAIAALCCRLEHDGWSTDFAAVKAVAAEIAARRNGPTCRRLRALRRKHKNNLHVMLVGRGAEAMGQVGAWIGGAEAVPSKIVAKLDEL